MIWAGPNNSSFYVWGGGTCPFMFEGVGAPPNDLWRFDADGRGGGSWTDIPVPDSVIRPTDPFFASANGVGYVLGGYVSAYSVPALAGDSNVEAIPGLTTYDMSSNVWANESTSLLSPTGLATAGQLIYVSTFGKSGVLVSLGGSYFPLPLYDDGSEALPFSEIPIYDIESGNWFKQVASGQVPRWRLNFCAAGVQGNNGTYEIFIHGGDVPGGSGATSNIAALDQIYVLSLPSFQWFEADYPPTVARFGHSCHVVGYGQRQLLIVGGAPSINSWIDTEGNIRDQWSWGLGVWDMTEMRWSDRYDAQAEPYVTSNVVVQGIQQNGQYPSNWTQPGVQQLFQKQKPASAPTPMATAFSRLNTGAIVGIVVAVLAFVFLLAVGILLYLRRQRRDRRREASEQSPQAQHQYDTNGGKEDVPEMAAGDNNQLGLRRKPVNEVEGDSYHSRPYGTRAASRELMGSDPRWRPIEMPS